MDLRESFRVILFDHRSDPLLLQRSDGAKTGYYCFPGGQVEHGETRSDAAIRETFEETGIHTDLQKIGHYSNGGLKSHYYASLEQVDHDDVSVNHESLDYRFSREMPSSYFAFTSDKIMYNKFITTEQHPYRSLKQSFNHQPHNKTA
jgi:8-oxo-dGTP pyrophosphatase MutT (NUDIX family)